MTIPIRALVLPPIRALVLPPIRALVLPLLWALVLPLLWPSFRPLLFLGAPPTSEGVRWACGPRKRQEGPPPHPEHQWPPAMRDGVPERAQHIPLRLPQWLHAPLSLRRPLHQYVEAVNLARGEEQNNPQRSHYSLYGVYPQSYSEPARFGVDFQAYDHGHGRGSHTLRVYNSQKRP